MVTIFCVVGGSRKILTMDNLRKRRVIVVDNVVCAKRMRSLWTIFFFIVRLLVPFGMFY
jgi:hypothetical protein